MDKAQEEFQFLGFFSILKESSSLISSYRKIFTQITLSLILPLSFIYLAHIKISHILFSQIVHDESTVDTTPPGTTAHDTISDVISSEWTALILFKIAYFTVFIVLALLSTAAVVYTVASIFTGKDITFQKVMTIVPKVWKRLLITFMWNFIIVFGYNFASAVVLILGLVLFAGIPVLGLVLLIVFLVGYVVGFFYITIIWHLASVVSVLEERYGLSAMAKSRELIRGKMGVSVAAFLVVALCFAGVQAVFEFLVVAEGGGGVEYWVLGLVLLSLLAVSILFGLVTETILYFVCKSYHHENIDKSGLADHLGGYLGEYVPLKSKDVQLEQFEKV